MLKISVLIPSYNQAHFLVKTLATVAKQGYPSVEVIIGDGGSSDRTRDVVAAYGSLVTHFASEPDRGQLDGIGRAIRLATGDIHYWLNADDAAMPGAFHAVARVFERHPDTDIVFSDSYAFNEPKRQLSVSEYVGNLDFWTHFLFYRQWPSESIYWRAGIAEQAFPLNYALRVYTDYSFFLPLRYRRTTRWISHRLGAFRIQPTQMSQVHHDKGQEEREQVKRCMRERLGLSMEDFAELQRRKYIGFLLYQRALPKLHSGMRFLLRKLTGDVVRRRQARFLFDDWLRVPEAVEAQLGQDFCRRAEHDMGLPRKEEAA